MQEAIRLYEDGKFDKAYKIFYLEAIKNKDSEAQLYLGMMYEDGDGVLCNIETAQKWYKKSYRQKNLDAGFRLESISQSTTCRC